MPAPVTAPVAEPRGYWNGDIDAAVPATLHGATVIHTSRLAALLKVKAAHITIIDVSNQPRKPDHLTPGAPWMPLPHLALPKAVWIPDAGLGELSGPFAFFLRDELEALSAGNRDAPLVIYCHTRCWLSWNAAKRAVEMGYRHVYWYPDGIEGWRTVGLPVAEVQATLPPAVRDLGR